MLIDKQHPHGQFEMMMMSAGNRLRPGLHDHSRAFPAALGALTASFARYCHAVGLYPILSWSYDPATTDRESIQGEKRFHARLVGRTQQELGLVKVLARPAGSYSRRERRRTVDEASLLGAMLFADCMNSDRFRILEIVEPMSTPQATACLQLRIPGGWQSFADGALFADLHVVHVMLQQIYGAISQACFTGTVGMWRRPAADPAKVSQVRLPLSSSTRAVLGHYLAGLRPELLANTAAYADPRNRDRTTHVYPLADLAYSVSFSEWRGMLYAYIRLSVFSDLGGAGVSVIDGTVVKVRKGVGNFDLVELAARAAFQHGFLTWVRMDPDLGAAAFYPALAGA